MGIIFYRKIANIVPGSAILVKTEATINNLAKTKMTVETLILDNR